MDLLLSLLLVPFLLPLMICVGLAVFLTDPGPVIFRQKRIGRGGRTFDCYKFRTMVTDAERRLEKLLAESPEARAEWRREHKLRNDPRITRIGRFLRVTSIDELPQLLNVIRGEMSLVGPRPICEEEIFRYGRRFVDYCSVPPGVTGFWQINGRSNTSYRRRIALDVSYIRARSLWFNMKILMLTPFALVVVKGAR